MSKLPLMRDVIGSELEHIAAQATDVADHLKHLQTTGCDAFGRRLTQAQLSSQLDAALRQIATLDAMRDAIKKIQLW